MQNLVVVSHIMRAHLEGHKIWGTQGPTPWDGGVTDNLKHCIPSTCVTVSTSVILGQTVRVYYENRPENFDPSRPGIQGHSRSLEPTTIDQPPMTSN